MQLIGAATPNVPNQTPMPQPGEQLLNACPTPPVHVMVTLLAGCQSAILSSNEWHNDMNPACINTIMAPNFEIKESTSGTRRSIHIPNQNIRRCPGGQGANPYNVAQNMNSNSNLVNMRCIHRIPQVSTPYPANGTDGHGVYEMRHKEWKMGTMVERIQPFPLHTRQGTVPHTAHYATACCTTSTGTQLGCTTHSAPHPSRSISSLPWLVLVTVTVRWLVGLTCPYHVLFLHPPPFPVNCLRNSNFGASGDHGPGYMGLVATMWVPMGATAPVSSPNDHPNTSQGRQKVSEKGNVSKLVACH